MIAKNKSEINNWQKRNEVLESRDFYVIEKSVFITLVRQVFNTRWIPNHTNSFYEK